MDPIPAGYVLEVSSPGIDRPLTRLKDFASFDEGGHGVVLSGEERPAGVGVGHGRIVVEVVALGTHEQADVRELGMRVFLGNLVGSLLGRGWRVP